MHQHRDAEGLVDGHPLVCGLVRYLKRRGIPPSSIRFLEKRVFFAYPRTLWLKLTADTPSDVKSRHELNPEIVGRTVNEWLTQQGTLRNVVFDLRDVTIVDLEHTRILFEKVQLDPGSTYYLCDRELANVVFPNLQATKHTLFHAEHELLAHLRSSAEVRPYTVELPEHLTMFSLDGALRIQASGSRLTNCDAMILDMKRVLTADFQSLSLLAPIIHSVAHTHGILTAVTNPSRKVAAIMNRYGALRVVTPYLLRYAPGTTPLEAPWLAGLDMKAFTGDELLELQDICHSQFNCMLRTYSSWFTAKAGLSGRFRPSMTFERKAELIVDFRQLIKELAENVAVHAHGLGYLMMELKPTVGLSIYVGDTGLGLARGISRAYRLPIGGETRAVAMALRLIEQIHRRIRLPGTLSSGGRGLERVSVILERLSGQLWVRSGPAIAAFSPSRSRKPHELRSRLYGIQGTHVHIFIPSG